MGTYHVIGLMSGSSLDGLDIAYCEFSLQGNKWKFKILKTQVVPYLDEWAQALRGAPITTAQSLWQSHTGLGNYFGECANAFIKEFDLAKKVDFIASHGHTIFHFPEKKFTTQIGDGAAIAAATGLPVVCDFRSGDVASGGQGTPIVPIGDKYLFPHFKYCLNIGGIANISCKADLRLIAFDICSANQILNMLANRLNKEYDAGGEMASKGNLNEKLLQALNDIDYYKQVYPKSLDNSFSREVILPVLEAEPLSIEDKLRTYTEHIAIQIAKHIDMIQQTEKLDTTNQEKILATGGGAFNRLLISRIQDLSSMIVEVPGDETVKFKEALVIGFMGVLRMRSEVNIMSSVTGATRNSVGGAVYLP